MGKKEFEFYQDVKVTVWARQKFSVEAESKEEALKMVEEFKMKDIGTSDDSHLIWDTEWMTETWEDIPVEENGGCATIELYDGETKKLIGDNAMDKSLSAMERTEEDRKLIGYQIEFDEDEEWPEELFSFQVFRAEQDAYDFLESEGIEYYEGRITKVYEGDVEEPMFIGKKPRTFKKNEKVSVIDVDGENRWAVVEIEQDVEEEDDMVGVCILEDNFASHENNMMVAASRVYQIAEGKVCPRCGGQLCVEHEDDIDYPYFCPECGENFYNCELE